MEKELQPLSDSWSKVTTHIVKYLDLKKDLMANDYVELLGDSLSIVKFIKNTSSLITKKKFQSFLKGFNPEDIPTEEQVEKLIKYIDNESKAEFIADTFAKVLLSNSSKACLLMGILLKTMLEKGDGIEHSNLVCISALTTFFDVDLKNFSSIINYVEYSNDKPINYFDLIGLEKYSNLNNLNYSSILLTIEKSVSSQLIRRLYLRANRIDFGSISNPIEEGMKELAASYQINEAGVILKKYLERVESIF